MAEPPSSPPSADASAEDSLAWYKFQYEQLESELSEFQASSKELEAELERDLDAADKRERALQERAETAGYEVEEWKRKYKESKAEANAAQNALEREITTLRDANRTMQLKLRDIEVANDDYERQARNKESSLEDLESKYNVAIERGVMMEEEIKTGEQEREQLRVDAQRLREELSDLKIEAEILQDKIKKQEQRHYSTISTDLSVPASPTFAHSPASTASSPLVLTPPDSKSLSTVDTVSEIQDPPSPPRSDASVPLRKTAAKTPGGTVRKSRLPSADNSVTPKPRPGSTTFGGRVPGARLVTSQHSQRTPARPPTSSKTPQLASRKLPASNSLSHIRSLTAQMQRLEARVHSVRSKLPAPTYTPPRASPRSSVVPSTVTIRSKKRTAGSTTSSTVSREDATPLASHHNEMDLRSSVSSNTGKHIPRLSTSGVSRLSFGPLPNRNPTGVEGESRPSSRASVASHARPPSRTDGYATMPPPRPMSRASFGGTRTPLRPRSSLGSSLHGHGHGHSQSVSYSTAELDELDDLDGDLRTPSRRSTYSRLEMEAPGGPSGIPTPSGIPGPSSAKRQSGGPTGIRRTSGDPSRYAHNKLGETY